MWEELLDDQHSCARGCWVATGLSRWMGCSDLQGPGRGRESINQASSQRNQKAQGRKLFSKRKK